MRTVPLRVTSQTEDFPFSIEPIIKGIAGAGSPLQIEIIGSLSDADV